MSRTGTVKFTRNVNGIDITIKINKDNPMIDRVLENIKFIYDNYLDIRDLHKLKSNDILRNIAIDVLGNGLIDRAISIDKNDRLFYLTYQKIDSFLIPR